MGTSFIHRINTARLSRLPELYGQKKLSAWPNVDMTLKYKGVRLVWKVVVYSQFDSQPIAGIMPTPCSPA